MVVVTDLRRHRRGANITIAALAKHSKNDLTGNFYDLVCLLMCMILFIVLNSFRSMFTTSTTVL